MTNYQGEDDEEPAAAATQRSDDLFVRGFEERLIFGFINQIVKE